MKENTGVFGIFCLKMRVAFLDGPPYNENTLQGILRRSEANRRAAAAMRKRKSD